MIVYNSDSTQIIPDRIKLAKEILEQIPAKHCFITGSFLYKKKYKDIDIFIISRSKKKFKVKNKKAQISIIDFNIMHSLLYHSLIKTCISKGILPSRPLKVTMSNYWGIINDAVPTIGNFPSRHKDMRSLALHTEYFQTGRILDSKRLSEHTAQLKGYRKTLRFIEENVPAIFQSKKKSYLKRYFYGWASRYKELKEYDAYRFLYRLTHKIINY